MHPIDPPDEDRYTGTAIALHWIVAVLIVGSFAIGLYMVTLDVSPRQLRLYSWHKWVGVTIALLMIARVGWRLTHAAPALPATMAGWQRALAHATHLLLYVLLLALPVTGWLMSSAAGFPVVYFGVVPLPDLVSKDKALAETFKVAHYVLNKTLLVLVALHVAAALKHHFRDRDTVLGHMLPFLRRAAVTKEA
jgi:cytochrome b561